MTEAVADLPRADDSYGWQWLVFFLLAALAVWIGWGQWQRSRIIRLTPTGHPTGTADWFFILRMPEIPTDPAQNSLAVKQLDRWFAALSREGFKTVLFSQIHDNVKSGAGLPEKSVVLMFEPGYRQTHEAVAPVLAKHGVSAVWLTDQQALRRHDRRYVSQRSADEMAASGWWDVGWKRGSGGMVLKNGQGETIKFLSKSDQLWGNMDGRSALNHMGYADGMRRLNANLTWSSQELVDRLLAEKPLVKKSHLTLRRIGQQDWGVLAPTQAPESGFELKVPFSQRGTGHYWLGTRGVKDIEVELKVSELLGELWVLLRDDSDAGQAVRIAFTDQALVIEEEHDNTRVLLKKVAAPALQQPARFSARIHLDADRLRVAINGSQTAQVDGLGVPGSSRSLVRLLIYDKVTGAARAGSVHMAATPLRLHEETKQQKSGEQHE